MATEQEKHAVKDIKGAFKRSATEFHDKITAEASKYTAEPDRYHLYYSAACPWCHRVLSVIALKGLQDTITASNVSPLVTGHGTETYLSWRFNDKYPDPLHKNTTSIWDIYKIHDKDYPNKKLTVPIIFDKKTETIVNNESAEIIAFLNSEFNQFAKNPELDLNPRQDAIQTLMQKWNDVIYPGLNDGVYRCGFAKSQEAYNDAVVKVFNTLDKMEKQLAQTRYLCGDVLTLSDIRAWVTLVRFDAIYFTHFKCNVKMIRYDYPNIWGYTRDIYQMNGSCVGDTFDLKYSKLHYYASHNSVNPHGIVAKGPMIRFDAPHHRDKQKYKTRTEIRMIPQQEEDDMKPIETVRNELKEWDANMDDNMQRCAQIAEDLNNEISNFKVNCSASNIDNIGIQNVDQLVVGNSMFHSKLIHFREIVANIKGRCIGFTESMDEVEQYVASQYVPNAVHYEQWDLNDIGLWIKSLECGRFVPYIDVLLSGFKQQHIVNGSLLCDLETANLGAKPFAITNFKDKRDLIRNFKRLKTGIQ